MHPKKLSIFLKKITWYDWFSTKKTGNSSKPYIFWLLKAIICQESNIKSEQNFPDNPPPKNDNTFRMCFPKDSINFFFQFWKKTPFWYFFYQLVICLLCDTTEIISEKLVFNLFDTHATWVYVYQLIIYCSNLAVI